MKNLFVAAIVALFAFAANAAEMKAKDGTMLKMEGDMYTMMKDGKDMPAEGEFELEDGTKLKLMGGKKQ